jgi:hypothetical protein
MAASPKPKEVKAAYRFQRVYADLQTGHAECGQVICWAAGQVPRWASNG